MLYTRARDYLIQRLKEAGLKTRPYTTMKSLEKSQESHVGAVLFDSETVAVNGSKTYYKDQEGAQRKRRKLYDRDLAFTVVIGDYSAEAAEGMYERFLSGLDRGLDDGEGNFVPIEPEGAIWAGKDDSILRAAVAVQVRIRFLGGVYRDEGTKKVAGLEAETVREKQTGKDS